MTENHWHSGADPGLGPIGTTVRVDPTIVVHTPVSSDPFQFCSCCLYLYFDRDRHNNELYETRHEATTYNDGMRLMPGKQSEGIFRRTFFLSFVGLN